MKDDGEHLTKLEWALEFITSRDLNNEYDRWCRARWIQEIGFRKDGKEDI